MKPTLVLHPTFEHCIESIPLLCEIFDIKNIGDFQRNFAPIALATNSSHFQIQCKLRPYYHYKNSSGSLPQHTSYSFPDDTVAYTLDCKAPRYVIWDLDSILTVCATEVDRVDYSNITNAFDRAVRWAFNYTNMERKSIAVVDLDETLIDDQSNPLKGSQKLLNNLRDCMDYVVLWSHGSPVHVDENVDRLNFQFDLVLSNAREEDRAHKNILHLYNHYPKTYFHNSVLLDDSIYNWTPEYSSLIVPYKVSNLEFVYRAFINQYAKTQA